MISNDSIENIKEYTGTKQIGSISFTIEDNLITTNDITNKTMSDLEFQEKLYQLLKNEFESFEVTSKKIYDTLKCSKNVGIKNIETLINGDISERKRVIYTVLPDERVTYYSLVSLFVNQQYPNFSRGSRQ